jgi:thiol-disulfide isomerase/thioredoxin
MRKILFLFLIIGFYTGCISPHSTYTKLPPGKWRGVLYLDDKPILPSDKDEITIGEDLTGQLPFIFEVVYDNEEDFHIVIHNGEERIKVDNITYGRDKSTAKDTVIIDFPDYDTKFKAIYEEKVMEGKWIVNYKDNYAIRFKAFQGTDIRFRQMSKATPEDFSGRYDVTFSEGTENAYPGVGIFEQTGEKITGTFLTETGDYRYLDGKVVGNKAYLSAFDGAHAFLFELKKDSKDHIIGEFRSGSLHREPLSGKLNPQAKLKSGYDLVKKVGNPKVVFNLPNHENKMINTAGSEYAGKVKVYEIMGTWCPNCKDATNFLKEFQATNKDVAITALAFERYRDSTKSTAVLAKYVKQNQLNYPILLTGYYDKKEASTKIPSIEKIMAYPTLLIVDKNDQLQKVYTGFNGPATKEYETFKSEFSKIINELKNK